MSTTALTDLGHGSELFPCLGQKLASASGGPQSSLTPEFQAIDVPVARQGGKVPDLRRDIGKSATIGWPEGLDRASKGTRQRRLSPSIETTNDAGVSRLLIYCASHKE
jgi:hypothetical protein